jgi:hypothetical protein
MRNLSFQQIILLIVVILVPLISVVIQRVRRHLEEQTPKQEPVPQTPRRAQATLSSAPTLRASRTRVDESQAPTLSTPFPQSHFTKRSIMGSRRDTRRGIIMMTILGPCRALESPEPRRPESGL